MEERPAEVFAETMRRWRELGEAGQFLHEVMGAHFDFSGISHTPPTETFSRRTDLQVGDLAIELHELGPAHTRGDIVAYVPSARTVFTGDIVFNGGHPIVWAGPISNWIEACDRILGWNVDIVVPGHGAVTDLATVRSLREYFVFVRDESGKRFKSGMPFADAAWDIALDAFDSWIDRERIVANVAAAYRDLSGGRLVIERNEILILMGRYRSGAKIPNEARCAHNHDHD
jgi:glyoxylase-like metal-dependent hydrolase (beta-lactamase superfamily II)